jgi:hypothetical protein
MRTPLPRSVRTLFTDLRVSQDFQGFLEGGASTGQETARAIAHRLRGR